MTVLQLLLSFLKIGIFSFGGGYAMLPLIEKEIVVRHAWITHADFVDIVAIAQITPGPIAINSATFVGYRVAGILGSIAATVAVVAGPTILLLLLAKLAGRFAGSYLVRGALAGLKPALLALVAYSAVSVSRASFPDLATVLIAAAAFAALMFTKVHPLFVLAASGLAGVVLLYL